MSDKPAELASTETTTETTTEAVAVPQTVSANTPKAPPGVLTHASDFQARPGFRSPPNNKSKADKNAPKKKKK
ncbi:MAG: hypothetical protein V4850_34380 [Myxococcota bacterium]